MNSSPYYDYSNDFIHEPKSIRNKKLFKQINESKQGNQNLDRFYVYVYLDPRNKGEYKYGNFTFNYAPFYVGKGQSDRLYAHLYYESYQIKSHLKYAIIEQIKQKLNRLPLIIKVVNNVSEEVAFEVESYLINQIGRIYNSTGILTNKIGGHKSDWDKR